MAVYQQSGWCIAWFVAWSIAWSRARSVTATRCDRDRSVSLVPAVALVPADAAQRVTASAPAMARRPAVSPKRRHGHARATRRPRAPASHALAPPPPWLFAGHPMLSPASRSASWWQPAHGAATGPTGEAPAPYPPQRRARPSGPVPAPSPGPVRRRGREPQPARAARPGRPGAPGRHAHGRHRSATCEGDRPCQEPSRRRA